MQYAALSLFVVLLSFAVLFQFENHYECTGDWGTCGTDQVVQSTEPQPERLNVCLREGFGSCVWRVGAGTVLSDPWFTWETKYIGEWKDNKKSGHGKYFSMSGMMYEGAWELDQREGYGKMLLPDKDSFVSGIWREDQLTGASGTLQRSNSQFYRGNLRTALMDGTGTLTLDDYQVFARFSNGSMHTDVGEISKLQNESKPDRLYSIHHWYNHWNWTIFSVNASVTSIQTETTYYTTEELTWRPQTEYEASPVQEKEIQELSQLLNDMKEFEDYFQRVNMQVGQAPYQF